LSAALSCAGLEQFTFDEPSVDSTKTIVSGLFLQLRTFLLTGAGHESLTKVFTRTDVIKNNSDDEIDVGGPAHNVQPCTSQTMVCAERGVDKREHTQLVRVTQSPRPTYVRTQYLRGGGQQLRTVHVRSPIDLNIAGASRFGTPVNAGAFDMSARVSA
jgi:hypothetical protein